ncbi:carboxypeptidase-like regulatory domain-containing protein [Sediminibacterium sp.]|uniref:carboxypeptidase-like regulatory domain-containing protein n=1 Tax=Sediminibacterium sp. TaxID=1917865 RepID=UPI002719470E|nr:carboxypeptidase-like regulatory domain-containing protein [Sediminibacterium sp.]MDO9000289.1 carboxypeptidase-like regulatory domain-containing protein [Bacteroidota bacterium]MDP3147142.1 carboxypeptidase-like regulatory domain-containing protein [Bacteroidota bacterium]MDP3567328.1 carboxypeptidase-like regulatory domain-containing protein [Sediminibacterium sp.]
MKKLIYIFLFFVLCNVSFAGNSGKEKASVKTIAGKITDVTGETIAGAKIIINETGETFFADFNGNFKLSLKTDKIYSISINTIGYQPLEIKSTSLSLFSDISLSPLN